MNLETLEYTSSYEAGDRRLSELHRAKVVERQAEEANFALPADFDARLKKYLDELRLTRLLFPRGIGWRLGSSGGERFYNPRTGALVSRIPSDHDLVFTLPDKVLYEALCNNVLTDLGITMLIRVDTNLSVKRTYAAFTLMGLHDYRYLADAHSFVNLFRYYVPTLFGRKPGFEAQSAAYAPERALFAGSL